MEVPCRSCDTESHWEAIQANTEPERIAIKLGWDGGEPYFEVNDTKVYPADSHFWHGYTLKGVAYTRVGFKFEGHSSFVGPHWVHEGMDATHIVFKKVGEEHA